MKRWLAKVSVRVKGKSYHYDLDPIWVKGNRAATAAHRAVGDSIQLDERLTGKRIDRVWLELEVN